jgi:glucose-specific phosphotransferase system IIA component
MNWMGNLQHFGRALMLPMIALPAASLFLSLANLPWGSLGFEGFDEVLRLGGNTIFTFLPIIFAIGVALGLTENAGMAGMSSLLAYFLCTQVTQYYLGSEFQINVTGGILIGIASAWSFHRFKTIEFPEYIQFFGGSRFVPLFMSFASLVFSYLFINISPWLSRGLTALSTFLLDMGGIGVFLYGMIHRLLVPSGLHHILNNVFWFQIGDYERADSVIVHGDLPRFFAGDPSAGIYMAGLYPTMMFALPAIAFAIIHEAREDLKPKISATFITAAMACFFTGVTEPIEFAFLFVAPILFIVHAVLSGLSMLIVYWLDIHHGFSFSAGAIDFVINLHLSTNGWLIIPIGLVYGLFYYVVFRWAIRRFDLATPGREDGSPLDAGIGDIPHRSPLILEAIGGKHNIVKMEACITRLRLDLRNDKKMDIAALKHLGAVGVIHLGGGHVQVVFGTLSELIREEMMKLLRKDVQTILFHAPVQGLMIPLKDVPDPIFSGRMVGDGVAFLPDRGEVVAPVAGEIVHIHPTKHAIGIRTKDGVEVLLHIGIDTVHLQGKWFECLVNVGDLVEPGEMLLRFNLKKVKQNSKSLVSPMVITNSDIVKSWSYAPFKAVRIGQASVMSVVLKEVKSNE